MTIMTVLQNNRRKKKKSRKNQNFIAKIFANCLSSLPSLEKKKIKKEKKKGETKD